MSGRLAGCGAPELVIMVLDSADTAQSSAAVLCCPACGHHLAPWGYARPRVVQGRGGDVPLRPRRARCRGCGTTHVLFPASCLPRRSVTVDIVGAALLAHADGAGHRAIAASLDMPADNVRGWVRRATAHARVAAAPGDDVGAPARPGPSRDAAQRHRPWQTR